MGTKEQELITRYLGDMHALESHILQAIDKQTKLLDGHPDAQTKVRTFRDTLASHLPTLKQRLDELGGSPNHAVKEGVAAALGVAAGLIDKVRSSEAAKDLRDDYTALNHSIIAYQMLYTTTVAAGDQQTAGIARRHLQDNAQFVMEINNFMPKLVLDELREDGLNVNADALDQANAMTREVWRAAANS
jgi:ferritin-like metal-binding protein YciE